MSIISYSPDLSVQIGKNRVAFHDVAKEIEINKDGRPSGKFKESTKLYIRIENANDKFSLYNQPVKTVKVVDRYGQGRMLCQTIIFKKAYDVYLKRKEALERQEESARKAKADSKKKADSKSTKQNDNEKQDNQNSVTPADQGSFEVNNQDS